jgi:hypothetical protein
MVRKRRMLAFAIWSALIVLVVVVVSIVGALHMRLLQPPTGVLLQYKSYSLKGIIICPGPPAIYGLPIPTFCSDADSWDLVIEEHLGSPPLSMHQWRLLSLPFRTP